MQELSKYSVCYLKEFKVQNTLISIKFNFLKFHDSIFPASWHWKGGADAGNVVPTWLIIEIHHPLHSFVHISVNYIFDETKILQKQAKSKSKYLSFVWVSRKVVILIFYFCSGLCDANILFGWMLQISNQHSLIRGDPFFKG